MPLSAAAADPTSEPAEKVARKDESTSKRQSRRVDDANLAKLVAEENASKSKFPQYPGLERWDLVEKMGDGAFSNVYRARDTEGQYGEVAIKVVRKYEMNNMQVCPFVCTAASRMPAARCLGILFLCSPVTSSHSTCPHSYLSMNFTNWGARALDRETIVCIQSLRECPRQTRCDTMLGRARPNAISPLLFPHHDCFLLRALFCLLFTVCRTALYQTS